MSTKPRKPKTNSKNKPQCLTVQSLDELDSKLLFSVCVQDSKLNMYESDNSDDYSDTYIHAQSLVREVIRTKHGEDWFKSDLEDLADEHLQFRWCEISGAFRSEQQTSREAYVVSKIQNEEWHSHFETNYINFVPFAVQFLDVEHICELTDFTLCPPYKLINNELKLNLDRPEALFIKSPEHPSMGCVNTKIEYATPKTNNINNSDKTNNACNMRIPHGTGIELLVTFLKQNFFDIPSNSFQQYLTNCKRSTSESSKRLAKDYYIIFDKTDWKIPRDLFCHIRYLAGLRNIAHSLVSTNRALYGHPND